MRAAKTPCIELPLLLPAAPEARDACVVRLEGLLAEHRGVTRTHVILTPGRPPELCLHYDPEVVTGAQVERMANVTGAQVTAQFGHAVLPLDARIGEGGARRIQEALGALPGVLAASVNVSAQRVRVEFDRTELTVEAIELALVSLGCAAPHVGRDEDESMRAGVAGWYDRHSELAWGLGAGALLLAGFMLQQLPAVTPQGALPLYLAALTLGAYGPARRFVYALRARRFTLDADVLVLLAALGTFALGAWAQAALVMVTFTLARVAQHVVLDRVRGALDAPASLAPRMARVRRAAREVLLPTANVRPGDVVVVRPGERIPVDGQVLSGGSAVDESPLTGQRDAAVKGPGEEVLAGSVNGAGALTIMSTRAPGDRAVDRLVRLLEEAQTLKAPAQLKVERAARALAPAVLAAAVLVAAAPLLGWLTWTEGAARALAVLVAAAPLALAVTVGPVVLAALARAARGGVLVKGGGALEQLAQLRTVAFDQTGTLTHGEPRVTDVLPAPGVDASELLRVAAAVERRDPHPQADAVVQLAEARALTLPDVAELQSVTSRGVRAMLGGVSAEVGGLRLWGEAGVPVPPDLRAAVSQLQRSGRSTMVVRYGGRWLGVIGVADRPRAGARSAVAAVRARRVHTVMLSGDVGAVAAAVGRDVGVDAVQADLPPGGNALAVRALVTRHGPVALVGDGVSDAPGLASATVGIVVGGAASPVAPQTADVALMGGSLERLPFALALARRARTVAVWNVGVALAAMVALLFAAATGLLGAAALIVLHEVVALLLLVNAARLLGFGGARRERKR